MTDRPPEAAPIFRSDRPDELALRDAALAYPESYEDHPWGERAVKVRRKAFCFISSVDGVLRITVKLPESNIYAAMQPYAEPAGYNLGRAGWVTASFGPDDPVPHHILRDWIDESYRAIAPKRLVAQLAGRGP
jgi:predicted DNA-binding protein (MmcQ/YjbR family)